MRKYMHRAFLTTVFLLTVFSYAFVDPNFIYLQSIYTGLAYINRSFVTIGYILIVTVLFVFYFLYLRNNDMSLSSFKKIVITIAVILAFAYPAMLSYDIFNYTTTAKVLFYYQENPYIIMPISFVDDPFLLYTRAANKVALYGPAWLGISGIPHFLGFNNFLLTLINFKLLIAAFYLGTLYLLWLLTKDKFSLLLFGLHPLVLIQTLLSGHNDIVMMFFALAAVYFLKNKTYILVILCLVLSVFIKFATIVLLPIVLYVLIAQILKRKINYEKVYIASAIAMTTIFFLSFIREEIYAWYAVWFLVFTAMLPDKKNLQILVFVFTGSLLLRDVPYMLTGDYFGMTPMIKILVTAIPVTITAFYLVMTKKINLSIFTKLHK